MATLTTTVTLPAIERTTRQSLMKRVLRETGAGSYGTATGGSVTTVVDTTQLKSIQYPSSNWVGGWVRMVTGLAAGQISAITGYTPSTGTITVNPAFTGAVASTDAYELWRFPHPQQSLDILDTLITQQAAWLCVSPLSEVADFDMEQAATTDWAANSATLTKLTTDPPMSGLRYLSVAATGANGYARSNVLETEPNTAFHVSSMVRASATGTTAKLVAYDETNSAEIPLTTGANTSTRLYNHRLWGNFTTPATCFQISVRLTTVENGKTTHWDDVILYNQTARDIALPWWVRGPQSVLAVFRLDPRSVSPASQNVWDASYVGVPAGEWDFQPAKFGRGQTRLTTRMDILGNRPLFIYGKRNELAFTDDTTDVKHIDENHVIAGTCFQLFSMLDKQPNSGQLDSTWIKQAKLEWQGRWEEEERYQAQQIQNLLVAPPSEAAYFVRGGRGFR